jgi:hypothetical protein
MSERDRGWSFLVARGRRLGYRTILAPGFLTERRLHGLLADSASSEQMDASRPRTIELERPDIGRLTLVYRTEQVTNADIDGDHGDGLATDEHGRPLEILYGIVSREGLRGSVDEADLGAARTEALESYRRFLAEEDGFGVDVSDGFALRGTAAVPDVSQPPRRAPAPPALDRHELRSRHRPLPWRGAAVAVTLALMAMLLVGLLPRDDVHVVDVRAGVHPSSGIIDCSRPTTFLLQGTIETDGHADVVYHWQGPGWRGRSQRLAFEQAGSQWVPSQRHESARLPTGGYVLVIEEPERHRASTPHALRCLEPAASTVARR